MWYVLKKNEVFPGYCQHCGERNDMEQWASERPELKVVSEEEMGAIFEQYLDAKLTEWTETTEEHYWDMLEVLPPCKYSGGRFHMVERITANLVDWFYKIGDHYYTRVYFDNKDPGTPA